MKELYRPELNKALLALVNKPIIQSLLYDLDLLPEQLKSQKEMTLGLFAAYNRLEGVLLAFKCIEPSAPVESPTLEEIHTKFPGTLIEPEVGPSDEYEAGFMRCRELAEAIVDEHSGYLDRIGHLDSITSRLPKADGRK